MDEIPRENALVETSPDAAQPDLLNDSEPVLRDREIVEQFRGRIPKAEVERLLQEEMDVEIAEKLGVLEANLLSVSTAIKQNQFLRDEACKELGLVVRDRSSEVDLSHRPDKREERLLDEKRARLAQVVEEIRAVDRQLSAKRDPETSVEANRKDEPPDPQEKLGYFQEQLETETAKLARSEAECQVMQHELERNLGAEDAKKRMAGQDWKAYSAVNNTKTKLDYAKESIEIARLVHRDLKRELKTGEHFPSSPLKPDEARAFFLRKTYWPEQIRTSSVFSSRLSGTHTSFWLENEFEHYLNPELPQYRTDLPEYNDHKVEVQSGSDLVSGPRIWVDHGESFLIGDETWRVTRSFFRDNQYGPRLHVDIERVRNPET